MTTHSGRQARSWTQPRRLSKSALYKLASCALAAFSLTAAQPASAQQQQLREVVIGMPSTAIASGNLRFANEMGIFAKHGLRPRFTFLDNASVTTTALVAGSIDFAVSGSGEIIAAHAGGHKVVAIGNQYAGFANYLVISKAEADKRGLSPNAPVAERIKALEGLLIGVVSSTATATVAFRGAMAAAGVNARYTFLTQATMIGALENGSIQAFVAASPVATTAVAKGTGYIWLSGPRGDVQAEFSPRTSSTLQARRDFAEKNPDLVKAMATILTEFGNEVGERPAAVKAIIAKMYPDLDSKVIDLFFENEAHAWRGKQLTAKDMADEMDFMKRAGALPAERLATLDPAAMVYP